MASNPTSLGTPVLGSTEAALVFSVTSAPTSGALIVAVAHMFTNGETALSSLSISDTLGGLSWTKVGGEAYLGSGNECDTVIFYATAPASPTTGTITVTPSRTGAAGTGMYLSASQVTGQGSTPVGATGTSTNSATVSLGAPPAASSLVFVANTLGLGSDPAQGQPTGVTALYTDQHAGSFAYATAGYKNGSAGTSYTYPVNSNSSCAAIEILAATVPGAPTAATATAGVASATVTFTAPASNGGSPITGYTATSTPGGITGTVSGPTAAPITVSGLTPGTAYTFTVHATNAVGNSAESGASNAVTPTAPPPTSFLVQIDVTGTAFGGTPTWTDISTPGYVLAGGDGQPINITWGRPDETSDPQPRVLTMLLDNSDGRFTSDVATLATGGANPYYPNFDVTTRIRVTATTSGVSSVRFDGYLTDSQISYLRGGPACVVLVTASDASNRFSNDQPLYSMVSETILYDNPLLYLPLTDVAGSTAPQDIANASAATQPPVIVASKYGAGTVTFGGGNGPVAEATQALLLAAASGTVGSVVSVPIYFTVATAVSIRVNWTGSASSGVLLSVTNAGGAKIQIGLDGSGHLTGTAFGTTVTTTTVINDGKPHDLVVTASVSALRAWCDGVQVGSTALNIPAFVTFTVFQVGGQIDGTATAGLTSGTYSHAALYNSLPTVADHYTAGATGFAGERTDLHAARLLKFRPNTGSNLDVGRGTVGLHPVSDVTLWQALLETSHAEGGVTFIDGQGRTALRNRATLYDPASVLTLNAQSGQVEADLTFKRDSQSVTNDVQVSRPNGSSQRIVNARLKTKHGQRVYSGTINVNSDRDLRDAAGWLIAMLGTPRTKALQVTVRLDLEPSAAQVQAVLAATIWSVVTITNLPGTAPAASTPLLIEGGNEQIGVETWSITFNTAALPPKTLRADASPSANTKLDNGAVIPW